MTLDERINVRGGRTVDGVYFLLRCLPSWNLFTALKTIFVMCHSLFNGWDAKSPLKFKTPLSRTPKYATSVIDKKAKSIVGLFSYSNLADASAATQPYTSCDDSLNFINKELNYKHHMNNETYVCTCTEKEKNWNVIHSMNFGFFRSGSIYEYRVRLGLRLLTWIRASSEREREKERVINWNPHPVPINSSINLFWTSFKRKASKMD